MSKRMKKLAALLLSMVMSFGMSIPAFAAETDVEEPIVISLFDLDDPYLIEVVEVTETERTTSRPTAYWNLGTQGKYTYSAYSSNNVMWTKYIFFDPGNLGYYEITANSTNTNWTLLIYDCDNGLQYRYGIPSTSVVCQLHEDVSAWGYPEAMYFGIDTTVNATAVSVNGYVDLY